jgi:hypothetical protein
VYTVVSIVTFVPAVVSQQFSFQTVGMNMNCGIPQNGIFLVSLLDLLQWFSMTLTSEPLLTRIPTV